MTVASETAAPQSRRAFNWRAVALGTLILVLLYQIAVPLLMVIWTSFKTVRPGEPGFLALTLDVSNYVRAFADPRFWNASLNTLSFSLVSSALAFALGAFLAWVVDRTDTPFARFLGLVTLGRIIIPGILITVSWILVASPTIGLFNGLMQAATGVKALVNIYSFWGMCWVHGLEMVPLAYLLLSTAFQAMDPRLEEASVMTGAGTWRTLARVTFPLAAPAVGAAVLLLFVTTVETFEVPLLMGGRAGVPVYATEIYLRTSRTPVDWGLSSTYAVALLVVSVALLALYFRLLRHSERYQTVTGKDFRPRRAELGRWKYATCAASLLIVFLTTGVPFLMMLYASFLPEFVPLTANPLENFTWSNYTSLLSESDYAIEPLMHSTLLGLGTATVVMAIVSTIAYFVHKTRIPGRKALDALAFAAVAVPSVVLGAAFLWLYLIVPVPILGTLFIIGLAYVTKYLPFALRFVSTSMVQIHSELEEAADVAGAPWWKNFLRIYLPLLKPGLMAGWFWVMVHAYRELTIALMLVRGDNRTAATVIFDLWENGSFQELSAFGVLIFLLLIVLVTIFHAISRRYGIREYA
jgi:iron(III) transport system permease protein